MILGYGNDFLDIAPKVRSMKEIIISWISLNLKLLFVKNTVKGKDKPQIWRKYLQKT